MRRRNAPDVRNALRDFERQGGCERTAKLVGPVTVMRVGAQLTPNRREGVLPLCTQNLRALRTSIKLV